MRFSPYPAKSEPQFSDFKISKRLVIIGWCSRYVHVIADTGIIFGAFYALEKKAEEEVRRHIVCNNVILRAYGA